MKVRDLSWAEIGRTVHVPETHDTYEFVGTLQGITWKGFEYGTRLLTIGCEDYALQLDMEVTVYG